jgi:predicted  nucleic acid-binding Zn-ribbon protein
VTAVWFGVMVGLNLQTSFLTPPFGFSLFYLRGVAPPIVKTLHIYRGSIPFIGLQVVALVIVAVSPAIVNYLPTRISLSSETAPPPINPRMQSCIEEYLFDYYDNQGEQLRSDVKTLGALELSVLPEIRQKALNESLDRALNTFDLVAKVRMAEENRVAYSSEYRPQHQHVRRLQSEILIIRSKVVKLKQDLTRTSQSDSPDRDEITRLEAAIEKAAAAITGLQNQIPESWAGVNKRYADLEKVENKARRDYRNNVDQAYKTIVELRAVIEGADDLAGLEQQMRALETAVVNEPADAAIERIEQTEKALGKVAGASAIKTKLSKARRALKGNNPEPEKAIQLLSEGLTVYAAEVDWRRRAAVEIAPALAAYDNAIKDSIGLRLQRRLSDDQVKAVASCLSIHRDFSLQF